MADWQLVGTDPEGHEILWQGTFGLPPTPVHRHAPWGPPRAMTLRRRDRTRCLPLGPMLSLQECAHPACRQPAAFFFDGNDHDRKKGRHRTHFLEYFRGHGAEADNWDDVRALAGHLPAEFEWERSAYSTRDVIAGEAIVFRDFDREYLRPDYLLDAVWAVLDDQPRGYVHLVGPEGSGKSYAAHGLVRDGLNCSVPVLVYHIRPGALSDYRTFLSELADRAKEQLSFAPRRSRRTSVASPGTIRCQLIIIREKML